MKPDAVLTAFPAAAEKLRSYVAWLSEAGVTRGLIGPREVDRLWDRHIGNCAALAELIPANSTVIDIGSGAGLPGLVLAIVRLDLRITLLEPLQRRCTFLAEVVADLDLANVTVVRGRAQENRQLQADVVTARAVAPLDRLLAWALPLTKPGGQVLALKGESAAEELKGADQILAGRRVEICQCGATFLSTPTTVVRVEQR